MAELRNALYSGPFREYLSTVTGSGPLSGRKTDMAVNVYTPGCHLLCHDDVIGSRRVSYILYLTDPDTPWKAEWGGALRLYPTEKMQEEDGSEMKVPTAHFTRVIPPAFNQLSFFAVQPGESFHDVEEVYAKAAGDTDEDTGRVRMAISGWFHIPQEGEDGYIEGEQERQAERSSLAQLQGKADKYDLPQQGWIDAGETGEAEGEDGEVELDEKDLELLVQYMNPRYLTPDTVEELSEAFGENSSLQLAQFLKPKFQETLRSAIARGEKEKSATNGHPNTTAANGAAQDDWSVARPPHKHRYLYHQVSIFQPESESVGGSTLLCELLYDFFSSLAFKKWLSLATGLTLGSSNTLLRRFRRGLDYTLATGYDEPEPQLEICLGLTPSKGWGEDKLEAAVAAAEEDGDGADGTNGASNTNGSSSTAGTSAAAMQSDDQEATVGGYEMYMAGDDDDDADSTTSDHGVSIPSTHTGAGKRRERADPAIYKSSGADEEDGVLFTMPACWNTMSIVLRDTGVLKFVKYVSRAASGDRWDVSAEWKVVDDDGDDQDGDE